MTVQIVARRLTVEGFADFGDVLALGSRPLGTFESGETGEPMSVSLLSAAAIVPPFVLSSLERHVSTRRTQLPTTTHKFVVVAAVDVGGSPDEPRAFVTNGKQGVQFRRGVWHCMAAPIGQAREVCLIESAGRPLERFTLDSPLLVGVGLGEANHPDRESLT